MAVVNINNLIRDHLIQKCSTDMQQAIDNVLTFLFDKTNNDNNVTTELEKIVQKQAQTDQGDEEINWYYGSDTQYTEQKTNTTYPGITQQWSQIECSNIADVQQNLNKDTQLDLYTKFHSIMPSFSPLNEIAINYYKIPTLGEFEFQKYLPSIKFDEYTNNISGINAVTSQFFNQYMPACDREPQLPLGNGAQGERFAQTPERCAYIELGLAQNDYILTRPFYVELKNQYSIEGITDLTERLKFRKEIFRNNEVNQLNCNINMKIMVEFIKLITLSCANAKGHSPVYDQQSTEFNHINQNDQQIISNYKQMITQKQQISQTNSEWPQEQDMDSQNILNVSDPSKQNKNEKSPINTQQTSHDTPSQQSQNTSSNRMINSRLLQDGKEEQPQIMKTVVCEKEDLGLSNAENSQSGPEVDCSGLPARPFGVMTPIDGQQHIQSKYCDNQNESNGMPPSVIHSEGNYDIPCSQMHHSFRDETLKIINDISTKINLKNNVLVRMNNKLDCLARCRWVRELCRSGTLREVESYVNGYFVLPVYDPVYHNFDQHMTSSFFAPDIFACRYVCVMRKFSDDGAFGGTILCYDLQEGKYVILKYLKDNVYYPNFFDEIQKLLYINAHDRAAQAAKAQKHNLDIKDVDLCPNFVQMLDFFIQHGKPYIVFEYLGENMLSLFRYYQEGGRQYLFSLQQFQLISKQLMEQIYFLESLGIQHFDLKPENIVIIAKNTKKNYFVNKKSQQYESQVETQKSARQASLSQSVLNQSNNKYYKDVTNKVLTQQDYKNMAQILQLYQNNIESIQKFPESYFEYDDYIEVKLIDIGSYRLLNGDHQGIVAYGQSRFYRAPEVLLKSPADNRAEVFSIGTVLFEILTGVPLFYTSPNLQAHAFHLANIVGLLGPIPIDMIILGTDSYKYITRQMKLYTKHVPENLEQWLPMENILQDEEEVKQMVEQMQEKLMQTNEEQYYYIQPARVSFTELINYYFDSYECKEEEIQLKKQIHDFMKKCLTVNVRKRPTIEQLLKHETFLGGDGDFNSIRQDDFKPDLDEIIEQTNNNIAKYLEQQNISSIQENQSQSEPQQQDESEMDLILQEINDEKMVIVVITEQEETNLTIYKEKNNDNIIQLLNEKYKLEGQKIIQYLLQTWGIYKPGDRPLMQE